MDLERLAEYWRSIGADANVGASDDEIAAFESRYGVSLPATISQFYRRFNGIELMDENSILFWPIHEIGSVPEKLSDFRGVPDYGGIEKSLPDSESYFVFADHSIWCHVYAMRLNSDPGAPTPVLWIGNGTTWYQLADGFEEFIDLYIASPDSILYPDSLKSKS
ncbi:MAG: SMI1/KNR4 family protein [Candidatus Saccharimonas sp.]|nr:SMI1/KNR4 family protein [Planctomycetaceae bacterium]